MEVAISEAKARLTDLARRAEAGEYVVLTRHGRPSVRLVPVQRKPTSEEKLALLQALRDHGRANPSPGPSAARAADFLYGDDGLPG